MKHEKFTQMEKSNVEKQKLQLTTQMEKQQDIAQTCIVRSCNEIERASIFAMSEHFQDKWQPKCFHREKKSVSSSCIV